MLARLTNERGVGALLHVVAAVAAHAVRGLGIALQQGGAVDALVVGGDEPRRRRGPRPHIGIVAVARQAELLLRPLDRERIRRARDERDRAAMARQAVWRALDAGGERLAVRGCRKVLRFTRVARSARFGEASGGEFRARGLGRFDIVRAVTVLAERARPQFAADGLGGPPVKLVLEHRAGMAPLAGDRLDLGLVRQVVRVEPRMTSDARELRVRRLVQDRFIDEQRDRLLAGALLW